MRGQWAPVTSYPFFVGMQLHQLPHYDVYLASGIGSHRRSNAFTKRGKPRKFSAPFFRHVLSHFKFQNGRLD